MLTDKIQRKIIGRYYKNIQFKMPYFHRKLIDYNTIFLIRHIDLYYSTFVEYFNKI